MINRLTLTLCAALALSGCAVRINTADANSYRIHFDEGGWTAVRERQFAEFLRDGTVVYVGKGALCASACTMYLGLPSGQVCVHPEAVFRFHGAFPPTPENTWALAKYYPAPLQSWFYDSGASDMMLLASKRLTGADLHNMGIGDCT